jgi:PAS domain S-box-containing protein
MATESSTLHDVERALHESEARLQQVLDNTSAVVFAKDRAGRYLFVNHQFERLAARPTGEIVGRTDGDVFPPGLATRFRYNDLRVLHEKRAIEFEESGDFGDGERTFLSSKFPLFDADGTAYAVCGIATDITDRKRIEDALSSAALAVSTSEEETLYRGLARYLATILGVDGAFISTVDERDPTTMHVLAFYLDGRIVENFSYPLAGTPCQTVVGQQFRFYPTHLFAAFPADADFKKLGVEGYAGYPLNDATGRPRGLISVISRKPLERPAFVESVLRIFAVRASAELDRARAAEALRASEASYREIFEASEDAIFIQDWDTGAIVDANPRACESYGYTHAELLKVRLSDLSSGVPPYTEAEGLRLIEQAKRDGIVRFEWHRRNKDGSLHWDELVLKSARIASRPRVLAVTREITERKLREQELRQSEDRLRATVSAALDCIVVMDHQGRIIEFNPAAEACFGHRRADVLGRRLVELLVPVRGREQFTHDLEQYLQGGEGPFLHRRIETHALRADGSEFPVELATGVAQGADGTIFIGYLRDISELKAAEARRVRLEAQLRQAQKMEAIGQLTGGIAHDFNNLLTSIMGYVVLASERQERLGDGRLEGYLAQARRSCERARDLIQQMLMFSRGQRGTARPVAIGPLVEESLPLVRAALPPSIDLELEIAPDAPAARLDPLQFEQVLLNLCINARDASGGAGSLRIGVRPVQLEDATCAGCRASASGAFVELSVRDSGHGIAPEVVERIFEPFYSTKETGKGTGMGLAIVHGIVHEHGGHVLVETAPGQGARFRVIFPALPAETRVEETAESMTPRPRRGLQPLEGTVLVVDDEESVGEFMRELLDTWGLRATYLARPLEALDAVVREPSRFDVVITDQSMPRMTGVQLARALREIRGDLSVILYTGYSDGVGQQDIAAAGLKAVLKKPVDPVALRTALDTCLRPARTG